MAAPSPTPRPDPSAAVTRIALQVGATPMAHVDVGTMLAGVCSALPPAVGVAAAALLLTEPADPRDPEQQQVFASDDTAGRLGLIQHRAGRGPVPAAVRADRPLTVPDLTVSGPPELAAAAADCGLVRSLVVPLPVAGRPAGGLQLLAGADTVLDERTAAVLWPLVAALSARLADARELARRAPRIEAPAVSRAAEDAAVPPVTTVVPVLHVVAAEPAPTDVPVVPAEVPAVAEMPADASWPGPPEATTRLQLVTPAGVTEGDGPDLTREAEPVVTERDQVAELFAPGEMTDETPPTGQARLGWEGPEHTPPPTALPTRALPAAVPVLGRGPRPSPRPFPVAAVPTAVPTQRSGPLPVSVPTAHPPPDPEPVAATAGSSDPVHDDGALDGPTWRVPRHRLRDDD